ncbi:hypothetical protein BH11PSE12_BH11PSE12_08670 [soil metagenome]
MSIRLPALLIMLCCNLLVQAQVQVQAQALPQLETSFSCNLLRQEGDERLNFADQAVIQLEGTRIKEFQWESSLYRSTHGHECSIDSSDQPLAEVTANGWRILLKNSAAARKTRGYDFDRGLNCSIRLERHGEQLQIRPSCPTLCGSRMNFSALTVNLRTGSCQYDE